VDDAGKIVREVRVASEPEALLQVLTNTIYRFKRVGLEAGPQRSRRSGLAVVSYARTSKIHPSTCRSRFGWRLAASSVGSCRKRAR
jgi:hypothetical protein